MSTAQAFSPPTFGIHPTPCAFPCNSPFYGRSLEQIMIDKNDIDLIAAVIGMVTTVITALAGHVILGRKQMQETLDRAHADIAYLLAVEALHCEKHKELNRASFKLRIRKEVSASGLSWSGRFTPGRVQSNRGGRALSTTISARIIVLTKSIFRATLHAIAYLVDNVPRWFNTVLITVENGVTKTLAARLASMRNT
jgi:hypothetical protein